MKSSLLFICLFPVALFAQDYVEADSLKTLFDQSNNRKVKFDLAIELSSLYTDLAEENLAKSEKIGIWQGQFIEPYTFRKLNK